MPPPRHTHLREGPGGWCFECGRLTDMALCLSLDFSVQGLAFGVKGLVLGVLGLGVGVEGSGIGV
jgi:hypothetical protein